MELESGLHWLTILFGVWFAVRIADTNLGMKKEVPLLLLGIAFMLCGAMWAAIVK